MDNAIIESNKEKKESIISKVLFVFVPSAFALSKIDASIKLNLKNHPCNVPLKLILVTTSAIITGINSLGKTRKIDIQLSNIFNYNSILEQFELLVRTNQWEDKNVIIISINNFPCKYETDVQFRNIIGLDYGKILPKLLIIY